MKRSPQWSFMSVFRIEKDGFGLYLWRLRIFECPWFGIYLHAIHRPDEDRHLHDHPWPFVSLLLRGRYVEEFAAIKAAPAAPIRGIRSVRWINSKRSTDAHRIVRLSRSPTWTLVLRGRRQRTWGFLTESGWIDYATYLGVNP